MSPSSTDPPSSTNGNNSLSAEFCLRRRLAYIYILGFSLATAIGSVLEIQSREDLRASALSEKDKIRRHIVKTVEGAANVESIQGLVDQAKDAKAYNPRDVSTDEQNPPDENTLMRHKELLAYDADLGKLIEHGAITKDETLVEIERKIRDLGPSKPETHTKTWVALGIVSVLLTVYAQRFIKIPKTPHKPRFPTTSYYASLVFVGVSFYCVVYATVVTQDALDYLSSNALLAAAMVCGGVVGVLGVVAKSIVKSIIPDPAAIKPADPKPHADGLDHENAAGLLISIIGALVGGITFFVVKSGKHIFLSQMDPVDVSLNPFSSVLTAVLLGLFSTKYFSRLEVLAQRAFHDVE